MVSMGGYATVIVCKSSVTSKVSWICEAPLKGVTRFRLGCADQEVSYLRTAKQRQTWWNLICLLSLWLCDFCLQFDVSNKLLFLFLFLLNYMDITAFGIVWMNWNRFNSLIFQRCIVVFFLFFLYLFVVPIHKNKGGLMCFIHENRGGYIFFRNKITPHRESFTFWCKRCWFFGGQGVDFCCCLPTIMRSMGDYATINVCKSSVTSRVSWICEAPLKGVIRFRLGCSNQEVANRRTAKQRQIWLDLISGFITLILQFSFCFCYYYLLIYGNPWFWGCFDELKSITISHLWTFFLALFLVQ